MVKKVDSNSITLKLTDDEAYTLQILLGFVARDKECNSIADKLSYQTGVEMDMEDYGRVYFSVESEDGLSSEKVPEENNVVIRFN